MFTLYFTEVRLEEGARRGGLLHKTGEKQASWRKNGNKWKVYGDREGAIEKEF